ncbi:MAG: undecaprenyl/decaprenyl-phosphate alpha-N-acetylglucosaminyl 1-phosphate transferase, partial [Salinibacterium sp.]|nr:undecaprenyl/decaprenyl-phosphate alpha-N-acetylglucosaminyl 1-phosphate transferase [Salinibacterium sp.]
DWTTKLAGQVVAAGLLAWQGVQLLTLPIGGQTIVSPYLSLIITVLAIVLVMNAINFIDGLDGLVAGVAIISNSVFFVYVYLLQLQAQTDYFNLASLTTAVLIGACIGFLPLNFYPARLFMGDAGALLVGLMMAASAISVTGTVDPGLIGEEQRYTAYFVPAFIPILIPFAVLIIPLLDFALAVLRRLRAGKSPFTADRKHLHHRLMDMGHSHLHAVLIFYGWTLVVSVGCLGFIFMPWSLASSLLVVGLVVCTIITVVPLSRRKRLEQAAQSSRSGEAALAGLDPLDVSSPDSLDVELLAEPTQRGTPSVPDPRR